MLAKGQEQAWKERGKKRFADKRQLEKMKRYILAGLAAVLILGPCTVSGAPPIVSNCDIQTAPCTLALGDSLVTLDIQPRPVRSMADLRFRLTVSGRSQPGPAPVIDLGMPGMAMGANRVVLQPAGAGVYEGTGVIVRCPSGRHTWKAAITLPDQGVVEFVFDVID